MTLSAFRIHIPETPCHVWQGSTTDGGYGLAGDGNGHVTTAHRVAWEAVKGPIPEGLHLDHMCLHKLCVNVDHLELVTPAENNRRAAARRTHCPRGHEYSPENTMRNGKGWKSCRQCHNEARRVQRALQRGDVA